MNGRIDQRQKGYLNPGSAALLEIEFWGRRLILIRNEF